MTPTVGRIVLVHLADDSRWMPGIIVEVDGDNDHFVRIKVFHPDGDEFDPMWVLEETDAEADRTRSDAYHGSPRWKWPPRATVTP